LSLKEIIGRGLKEPESGLANALILGYKRTVSDDYLQKFSVIGLSHMIAISGTHITILAAIIMDFLLFFNLSRRRAFYFTIIFLIFYVVLTGNQASAVRSLIMGAIGLAAKEWGREFKFVNGLIVAGTGMLLINPRLLRDDLGFQLSFLAIMALIYIYPLFNVYAAKWLCNFKGKIFWRHKLKYILDILSVTIACQIISSPLLAINFNQVSVIAPLANLIILWVFDFLMVALLGALALSWFLPGLSIIFFLPSLWMLKYIYLMTNFLAQCPLAAVAVNNFGWIGVGLYYLILGLVVWWLNKQKTRGN
jgi:competence protein ComEC